MFKKMLCLLLLIWSTNVYGQVVHENTLHKVSIDSSYHCKSCEHFLLDAAEGIHIDHDHDHVHYQGILPDTAHASFQCAGCDAHLGEFSPEDGAYRVPLASLRFDDQSGYHCATCGKLLFDVQDRVRSDNSYLYFSKPIKEGRITSAPQSADRFYRVDIPNETVHCKRCDARIGRLTDSSPSSGSVGIRFNLGALKKKRKS